MTSLEQQLAKAKDDAEKMQICLEAVRKDGWVLKYVPEKLKTAKLCNVAVKTDGYAIKYVPKNLKAAVRLGARKYLEGLMKETERRWKMIIGYASHVPKLTLSMFQSSNLLTWKICCFKHIGNRKSLRKHITGDSFYASSFTISFADSNAFLLRISQGIGMVAKTLHITFVIHKLLFCKIRNSRNLKKTFEHHFIETLGHFAKSVRILKYEKHPVKVALALPLGFGESGEADINQAHKVIIANLRVKLVGKGEVLNNLIAAFTKICIKIKKTERIDHRNVVVVRDFFPPALHLAFLGKVSNSHAEIKEASLDKVLLFLHLHFHNEPCTRGIFALNIKHSPSLFPGFSKLDCVDDIHIYDRVFENPFKESVEEEQKQVFALLAGKGFFKCEVQCKRSELRARKFLGHKMPPIKNLYNKIAPLQGNIENVNQGGKQNAK